MRRTSAALASFAGFVAMTASPSHAESTVAITGYIRVGAGYLKMAKPAATRTGNLNETRMTNEDSRIQFEIREELGDGLAAIAFLDWKVTVDVGADVMSGRNHIGLDSRKWGRLTVGREWLHFSESGTGFFVEK